MHGVAQIYISINYSLKLVHKFTVWLPSVVTSDEMCTTVSALMTWSGLSIDQCLLTKWGGGCGVGWLPIWGYYPTMSTHDKLLISISTVGRWKLSLAEIDRVATTIKKMRLQKNCHR